MLAFVLTAFVSVAPTPAITIQKSGGVAGVRESVAIVSGARTATLRRYGLPARHVTLTAAERTTLRRAIVTAHLATPLEPYAGGCADCFEYDISSGGHRAHISEDRIPRRFGPLLFFYTTLTQRLSGTAGTR